MFSTRTALTMAAFAAALAACDVSSASVAFENDYPKASGLVVYQAVWLNTYAPAALAPGGASPPLSVAAASSNPAYVLLARGWDASSPTAPTSFIVLQSKARYAVNVGDALTIQVDDSTFTGNCDAGSALSGPQARFILDGVFAGFMDGGSYDAATCTTSFPGDAGGS